MNSIARCTTILAASAAVGCAPAARVSRDPAAEAAVQAALNAAIITRLDSTHVVPDSLDACPDANATDPAYFLAAARVLGSDAQGSRVLVKTQVVTVGQLRQTTDGFAIHVGSRVDTATWVALRDSSSGRWGTCGASQEGIDFARMIAPVGTTWQPPSATWKTVAALADSVRAAESRAGVRPN